MGSSIFCIGIGTDFSTLSASFLESLGLRSTVVLGSPVRIFSIDRVVVVTSLSVGSCGLVGGLDSICGKPFCAYAFLVSDQVQLSGQQFVGVLNKGENLVVVNSDALLATTDLLFHFYFWGFRS
jgi:hypothetical protein